MRKYPGNKPRARLNYEARKMVKTNGMTNYDYDKENSDFYTWALWIPIDRVIKQQMTRGKRWKRNTEKYDGKLHK